MILILDWAVRLALLPLLIAQALWVRRRTPQLPEPTGPREGVAGTGPVLRLLILGDSSAAGVGVATQAEALSGQLVAELADTFTVHWRLAATTGFTSQDALAALEAIEGREFDVVLTGLGVNDVTHLVSLAGFLSAQEAIFAQALQGNSAERVIATAVPPMGHLPFLPQPLRWTLGRQADRFDRALQGLCTQSPGVEYLRPGFEMTADMMAADGFHPGAPVYAVWAQDAAARIKALELRGKHARA